MSRERGCCAFSPTLYAAEELGWFLGRISSCVKHLSTHLPTESVLWKPYISYGKSRPFCYAFSNFRLFYYISSKGKACHINVSHWFLRRPSVICLLPPPPIFGHVSASVFVGHKLRLISSGLRLL